MPGGDAVGAPAAGAEPQREYHPHLGVHVVVGIVWMLVFGALLAASSGLLAAAWIGASAFLWFVGAGEVRSRRSSAGAVTVAWWLQTWIAPLFALIALVQLLSERRGGRARAASAPGGTAVSGGVEARIASLQGALESLRPGLRSLDRRMTELEEELAELRLLVPASAAAAAARPAPPAARPPVPTPEALPSRPAAGPRRPTAARPPAPPVARPSKTPSPARPEPRRDVDLAELLGARALAWAGGIVTLLGIVFFFVLAVDRGWIGPLERVGLGALASASLVVAGVAARRRYGDVYSAVAAAGAGIAGGYATLLAAAALYGLVGDLGALLLSAAIAAAGAAVALRWRSQTLASIGLVGATLVPLTLVFEGGLSVVGTGFVALVFAATAVVAIRLDWQRLLVAGLAASALQIWILVAQTGAGASADVVSLAAVFAALYLAAAIALERRGERPLERLVTTLVLASAALSGSAGSALMTGTAWGVDRRGIALLLAGAAYGLVAAALFTRPRGRDLSALLGTVGLALGAIGFADVLTGTSLAVAWAAQAAVLAWLGARVGETRYRLLSLAYLTVAVAYSLSVTAPPRDLFTSVASPAAGVPSLLAAALAALVVALYGRRWQAISGDGIVSQALDALASGAEVWRRAALTLASLLGVYGLSLTALALVQAAGALPAFAWGHVVVTGVWAAGGGITLLAGIVLGRRLGQLVGLGWLAAALLKVTLFDLGTHAASHAAWSALVLGIGYAAAAYAVAHLRPRTPFDVALVSYGGTLVGGALVLGAVTELVARGGILDLRGSVLLAAAGGFAALGATLIGRPGRRNAVSAFWSVALVLGTFASVLLVDSATGLVALWSAATAALALSAVALAERRLLLCSAALGALAAGFTLVALAPPTDLFVPAAGAADGVPALAFAVAGLLVLIAAPRRLAAPAADALDEALDRMPASAGRRAGAGAATLGVYGLSLAILGLAQLLGGGDVTTDFQRGHTAVSAFWGFVGLLALRFGLTRSLAGLKLAGFVLFGVALVKLFLYDLTMLSSVTRALSFLAVGAVLLLAGFFYQRLGARAAEAR